MHHKALSACEKSVNKDRFGSAAYIPTGGIDMLRDESVPASAYDVRVPREDEETPLWWEV